MTAKDHVNQQSDVRECFVICPIGSPGSDTRLHADRVKEFIIVPAASKMGFNVVRSDDISETGVITNQIIRYLLDAPFVIADLTGRNPNVFYELALRHAAGKPFAHLISKNETIPFDIAHARAIDYDCNNPQSVKEARTRLESVMQSALDNKPFESPVTVAAHLREFFKTSHDQAELVAHIVRQYDDISITVADIKNILMAPAFLKEAIPSFVRDQMENMLRRYSNEIEILAAVRDAGIVGVARRRVAGMQLFKSAIDEEDRDILIVGSSLKGLLQNREYEEIRNKLFFKARLPNFRLRFLLTHPIFADLRARQEHREIGRIGQEIIASLKILRDSNLNPRDVKLYLGTPTAFAVKTTTQMLINPYPYRAQAYESPCIIVRSAQNMDPGRSYYFYEHFNDAHFGAWDTNLAVEIENFDQAIGEFERLSEDYSKRTEDLLSIVKKMDV